MDPGRPDPEPATVTELWRYPVKSFQGERLDVATVGPLGLAGDRRYALREVATGRVMTAKRHGMLLEASARTESGAVVLRLPDGGEWTADDPAVHAVLSNWIGVEAILAEADPVAAPVFEMSFNAEAPDEDLFEWPVMEGTHQDLAAIHALTEESLAAAAHRGGRGVWDVRRFRPNVLIGGTAEVAPDAHPGGPRFVEDDWVGRHVGIGEVVIAPTMPTIRCPMPSRAQPGLERDTGIAATLRDHHDNNLGVYADVVTTGAIRVGDPVRVLD